MPPSVTDQVRRDVLLRVAMDVLAEADTPIPVGEVVAEVARLVELTEYERSLNPSGNPRFDTSVRYDSGWLAAIGWISKSRAGWAITGEGRVALAQYPPREFLTEAGRRYRQQLAERRASTAASIPGGDAPASSTGWPDPRWQVVRDAIAAVPEGSWTAYKDLAELSGLPARAIGTFLSTNDVPGAHRVLTVNGTIAEEFHWPDPDRTDDPRGVLEAEGIEFDDAGRAAANQRVTTEDLRENVPAAAPSRRAWLVRGSAVSGVNVVGQWLDGGFVSLAASHLRPIESGMPMGELRQIVETDYSHLSYNQRRAKLDELHSIINRMGVGDIVVTTSQGRAYLGRITGHAVFDPGRDPRFTIRRTVTWDDVEGIDFTDLPHSVQTRLRSSATVLDLTEITEALAALISPTEADDVPDEAPGQAPAAPRAVPVMREATLPDLPAELVKDLLVGAEWLGEFVELLRERRQVILHGPPGTGKTYLALAVAEYLAGDAANVRLVQFHPAYSYEDFFEGYRPTALDGEGRVGFTLSPGPLRKVVDQATEDPGTPYFLVIDEINRANLAKVFGELYFLLEYRDRSIDLMYASGAEGREFRLPPNVYLIGTMNTADRSIALVDAAMRRRFAFLSLHPDDPHLRGVLRAWLARRGLPGVAADLLDALNTRIPDRDVRVGPSYLMRPEAGTDAGLDRIWRTTILPLLEELHYGDPGVDVPGLYGLDTLRAALPEPVPADAGPAGEPAADPGSAMPADPEPAPAP